VSSPARNLLSAFSFQLFFMSQPPLLSPDEAQVFSAVFLLRPCLRGHLIARLHLPVGTIDRCLKSLSERRLLSVIFPPVDGGIKGGSPYSRGTKGGPPTYDLHAVDMAFAQLAEHVIAPILDENRLLRSQRDADLQYQANQLNRLRVYESALTSIAQHKSDEGQIASAALHAANLGPRPCSP
jgi:hypothetical protein